MSKSKKVGDVLRTEFFMPMQPPTITHQEKKVTCVNGKPHFYEPDDLKAARQKFIAHLGNHVPAEKYTGGVRMITKWCFPLCANHKDGDYRITPPDVTNLQKLLEDVMTTLGYWTDDCLVASAITEKFWSDKPGIYICIEELVQ